MLQGSIMSQSAKSTNLAGIIVSIFIIASVAAIGYYQFAIAPLNITTTTSTTVTTKVVLINITLGATTKTTDAYSPNPVKVVIGVNNTLQWYNDDSQSGGVAHTATARQNGPDGRPLFDTGVLLYGQKSKLIVLDKPGTYEYYCVIHPTTMRGTIIVLPATGGQVPSPIQGVKISIISGAAVNTSSPGYSPSSIVVVIGINNTVTWTNDDVAPHTVTEKNRLFDSGNMNSGSSFSYTFTNPGTYEYICLYHSWMHGVVIVKAKG